MDEDRKDTGLRCPLLPSTKPHHIANQRMALRNRNQQQQQQQRAVMGDLEMQGAYMAAEASLSMADVDITNITGRKKSFSCLRFVIGCFAYLLALGGIIMAIGAMAVEQTVIVYIAMGFAVITAPAVAVQRMKLGKEDEFREIHNELRQEVNQLTIANNDLESQNDDLTEKVRRLERAEAGLNSVVAKQGGHVNKFVGLVRENKEIQDEIKKLLIEEALHSIIAVVIKSDRDGDFLIDPEEIDALILRLQNSQGIEDLDEAKFRRMLNTKGKSLETVLEIAKNMLEEDDEENQVVKVSARGLHL